MVLKNEIDALMFPQPVVTTGLDRLWKMHKTAIACALRAVAADSYCCGLLINCRSEAYRRAIIRWLHEEQLGPYIVVRQRELMPKSFREYPDVMLGILGFHTRGGLSYEEFEELYDEQFWWNSEILVMLRVGRYVAGISGTNYDAPKEWLG